MSFRSNPFDRFSHFDPESKLTEFRKNFFENKNKMFADSNRWPNEINGHLMKKTPKMDENQFEAKEEGIPIRVVHERTHSDDRHNSESNDDKNHDSMSSFGSSQSQKSNDTSNSSGSVFNSSRSQDSTGSEPRVYHIPITVEPREGSTSSGYTTEVNGSTEQPRSRSSSHSSAHSVGSSTPTNRNRPFSPANSPANSRSEQSNDSNGRQIPIKIQNNDKQKSVSPPKESMANVKNNGTAQSKPKPKSGPFVTRIPVVNQTVTPPPMNEPTPEPIPESKVDPLDKINEVLSDLKKYEEQVHQFKGTANDKKYKFLDEMLTRFMIKLDTIDTNGIEDVRKSRKAAVLAVNQCIALLENRVDKNPTNVKTTELQTANTEEPMQTSNSEPTEHQMEEQTTQNLTESQNTTELMDTINLNSNNQQTNDSADIQNSSQNQSSNENKPNESQRKETAV